MPLDIRPVAAPTLANPAATPTLKGILLTWDALLDPTLFAIEVWAGTTNDRSAVTTTLLATVTTNYYLHTGLASPSTRYYWIRARNIYNRTDGAWTPTSATAGVVGTTLLTQTADIAANAVTSITSVEANSSLTQTAYSTWEEVFTFSFMGNGNKFIVDVQHLTNMTVTAGTTQAASAQQQIGVDEHTVYRTGTVSVTNGSNVVTGVGTNWSGNVAAGQKFFLSPSGSRYTIQSVDSNTQLTLTTNYSGTTLSGQTYYVITATDFPWSITMETHAFWFSGSHLLQKNRKFDYRYPFVTTDGKLYDAWLYWRLLRDNTGWSLSHSSVLRNLILTEVKR